jgi:O-Antigen ligase
MTSLQPSIVRRRYPVRYWILVAYCVGMPNFVRFDASGRTHNVGLFNPTSLSVIAQTLLTAGLFLTMTLLNKQRILQRPVKFDVWLWGILFVNFILSTLLAPAAKLTPSKITDLPLAVFRIGEWILMFLLLLSVYTREKEENATDSIIRLIGLACWVNIAMVWIILPVMPSLVYGAADDITSTTRLGGALIHPVHLAVLAGIGFFYALFFMKPKLKYPCCGLAALTLAMTYARSEQLLFLIAIFSYAILFARKPILRWAGFLSVFSVAALGAVFNEKVFAYLARGQGARNITTLSERTDVWKASFKAFAEHPYLGYGYIIGVKNAIKDHWNATNWVPPHSHSEFIQALVTGGIVAGLIMVIIYVRALISAIKQSSRDAQHMFLLIALIQVIGMACIMPLVSTIHSDVSSIFLLIYLGVVAGRPRQKVVHKFVSPVRSFTINRQSEAVPVAFRWRQNPNLPAAEL